jgi:hypothetical protein
MKIILKVGIRSKTYLRKAKKQVYLLILVDFHAPGSVSGSAFPIRTWIQDSQSMRIWIRNTALVFLVGLYLKGGKIHTTDRDVFKVMLDNADYAAVK